MSKIMSINAGSSSLKFELFEMPSEKVIVKGIFERIGFSDVLFSMKFQENKVNETIKIKTHLEAVHFLLERLLNDHIIGSLEEITGVGHRVAHGGEYFPESTIVDDDVIAKIDKLADFAPLHNPANLIGIKAIKKLLPDAVSVVVFDTSFHQTLPEENYLFPIPYNYYKNYRIRKYGFHGTSHKYVAGKTAELLKKPLKDLRIITCHLGNGASICAVDKGKSVNTSMGFTPNAGFMMGTRTGTIEPFIIPYIMEKTGRSLSEVLNEFNRNSGLLGVSGLSHDIRELDNGAKQGNKRAILALKMFTNSIAEYIAAFMTTMGGADAITFTAGIGENSALVREQILNRLHFLGISFDREKNKNNDSLISGPQSAIPVCVIPTNEELMIARDVYKLTKTYVQN
ncbi:acetate kinase [Bacillaceae bacterium Marseille-Q3522]|nr:acetate kinase [Bacillaceae bacterium Marseille-Q3522]